MANRKTEKIQEADEYGDENVEDKTEEILPNEYW